LILGRIIFGSADPFTFVQLAQPHAEDQALGCSNFAVRIDKGYIPPPQPLAYTPLNLPEPIHL
jgi:hypothetical protein